MRDTLICTPLFVDAVAVSVSENGSQSDEHLQIGPNQDRHNKKRYVRVL